MRLRKKVKEILLKKKDGRVDKGATLFFFIMIIAIMTIISLNAFNDMDSKNNIGHVGRNYMLRIESNGYLTGEDEQNMVEELKNLGVTNINVTGTTKSKVGYGKKCNLNVSGKFNLTILEIINTFNVKEGTKTVDISIDKKSTAKH